jgi:hydroxypyruvate isomerase
MIKPNYAAVFLAAALWTAPAAAQSADCVNLRSLIAGAGHGGSSQGEQYQAAASRQRSEIDRTVAYAQSLGCDRRQFLIFGSPPPPQCGAINAQIGKMQGPDCPTRRYRRTSIPTT